MRNLTTLLAWLPECHSSFLQVFNSFLPIGPSEIITILRPEDALLPTAISTQVQYWKSAIHELPVKSDKFNFRSYLTNLIGCVCTKHRVWVEVTVLGAVQNRRALWGRGEKTLSRFYDILALNIHSCKRSMSLLVCSKISISISEASFT